MEIVAGFEDNTFRPREAVSREQLIVMAVDVLGKVYDVDLEAQPQRDVVAFKDVSGDRWSANKIQWAKENTTFPHGTWIEGQELQFRDGNAFPPRVQY